MIVKPCQTFEEASKPSRVPQSERTIYEYSSNWPHHLGFGALLGQFKIPLRIDPTSVLHPRWYFLVFVVLLCFLFVHPVVYPSLKQIVDCGRLLLLLHWLHSNLPIAFRCPANRIFQPYPPKAVAFSNIFSNVSAHSTEYSRPLYPPKSVAFSNISSFCTDLSTSTFFSFFAWPKSR